MIITKGTEINMFEGYIIFDGYNGSGLFYGELYDYEDKHVKSVRLSEEDIKSRIREWDGKAPKHIIWEE